MNVWRLISHHQNQARALAWTKRTGKIAIGWGAIGDTEAQDYKSVDDIGAAIRKHYPTLQNSGLGGPSLWDFYEGMQPGDLVILSGSQPRELAVEVQSEYFWTEEKPELDGNEIGGDYQHQRRIKISTWNPEVLWKMAGGCPTKGQSIRRSLIRCVKPFGSSSSI